MRPIQAARSLRIASRVLAHGARGSTRPLVFSPDMSFGRLTLNQIAVVDIGMDEVPVQLCFTIIIFPERDKSFLAVVVTSAPFLSCHVQQTLPFFIPLQSIEAHEGRLTVWSGS